jgi:hypothetical protein
MADEVPPPGLDLVYSEVKERLNLQFEQVEALDTKAAFVVSTASVVVSIAISLPAASYSRLDASTLVIFGAGVAYYSYAMFAGVRAYLVRTYRRDPEPEPLRDGYLATAPEKTKQQLIENLIDSFNENKEIIRLKAFDVTAAMIFLMVQTLLLVGAIIAQSATEVIE